MKLSTPHKRWPLPSSTRSADEPLSCPGELCTTRGCPTSQPRVIARLAASGSVSDTVTKDGDIEGSTTEKISCHFLILQNKTCVDMSVHLRLMSQQDCKCAETFPDPNSLRVKSSILLTAFAYALGADRWIANL